MYFTSYLLLFIYYDAVQFQDDHDYYLIPYCCIVVSFTFEPDCAVYLIAKLEEKTSLSPTAAQLEVYRP